MTAGEHTILTSGGEGRTKRLHILLTILTRGSDSGSMRVYNTILTSGGDSESRRTYNTNQ